jgi:hypothetical protein
MERSVTDISAALGHLLAAEDPDFEAVYTLLRVSTDQMSDYKRSILVNSVQDPAMRQKVEELLATLTREALTTAGEE